MGRVFLAYGTPLTVVILFKYLGRNLSFSDDNWPVVEHNLRQGAGKVGMTGDFWGREGAHRITSGRFCVVVQAVLMFGLETWEMTSRMEKALEGFHLRAICKMVGMVPKNQQDGTCVCPPIGAVLATVGMDKIGMYIACCQNMVTKYIATLPIMDLCLVAEQNPGLRLSRQWWEQPALDILGIRAGHAAS